MKAMSKKYPDYETLKKTGARFYEDEAFHDEPNGCDTCLKPAQYMTCPDPEGDVTLYACDECVKKFNLPFDK